MKKLKFVLKNNNKDIINTECQYSSEKNFLNFIYENLKITIKKENDAVIFIRENETDILKIIDSEQGLSCLVILKYPYLEFSIQVYKFEYKVMDNNITLSYIIESDEGQEKNIILSLIN